MSIVDRIFLHNNGTDPNEAADKTKTIDAIRTLANSIRDIAFFDMPNYRTKKGLSYQQLRDSNFLGQYDLQELESLREELQEEFNKRKKAWDARPPRDTKIDSEVLYPYTTGDSDGHESR